MLNLVVLTLMFYSILSAPLANASSPDSFYSQTVPTLGKEKIDFARYKTKVVLVVNTASGCGYTDQLGGLQTLYAKYKDRGLDVLGFPSDDFKQESLDGAKLADFCQINYGVKFTMFAKTNVNGSNRHPVYRYLVTNAPVPDQDISWNFEKFLVDRHGKVVGRYKSSVRPDSKELVEAIEKALKS